MGSAVEEVHPRASGMGPLQARVPFPWPDDRRPHQLSTISNWKETGVALLTRQAKFGRVLFMCQVFLTSFRYRDILLQDRNLS
jgi:hypothetical protein